MHERETIAAARAGSRAAAEQLFDRHWAAAWRLAYAFTRDRPTADDVAQDAFERAFSSLARFDGRSSFRTWLSRIVINRALTVQRQNGRMVLGLEPDAVSAPEHDSDILDAVGRLEPDRRAAVVLRYWLDLTPLEIAQLLELPVGTVHSRLARALAQLRTQLEVEHVERA